MSHLCRLVPRAATNILYVSRMNAHNLPPGTTVKVPEAKSGHHIVSGSGQFIATDGPSATMRVGIGGGSSASMLPGAQLSHDKTNPTKTTGDTREALGKTGRDKAHESIFQSYLGQAGIVVVAVVSIYAAYRMLVNKPSHKTTLRTEHAKEHPHAKSTKPEKH